MTSTSLYTGVLGRTAFDDIDTDDHVLPVPDAARTNNLNESSSHSSSSDHVDDSPLAATVTFSDNNNSNPIESSLSGGRGSLLTTVYSDRSLSNSQSESKDVPQELIGSSSRDNLYQQQHQQPASPSDHTGIHSSASTPNLSSFMGSVFRRKPSSFSTTTTSAPPTTSGVRRAGKAVASSVPTIASIPRATIRSTGNNLARRSSAIKSRVMSPHDLTGMPESMIAAKEFAEESSSNDHDTTVRVDTRAMRRYRVGDYVLVSISQSRWANLVNKHGFPLGQGETAEEKRGPYKFVLAKVKKLHFEEIATYYTITRCDSGADQRADAEYMEPLLTAQGIQAALKAASYSNTAASIHDKTTRHLELADDSPRTNKCVEVLLLIFFSFWIPFFCLYDCLRSLTVKYVSPCWRRMMAFVRGQATLMLHGLAPYQCRMRLTCVNFVVLCSSWFMFADQLRLAAFPPSSDYAVACVNLGVWLVLVIELMVEVFIRPEGYHFLIVSEKAFSPTTVRYISAFHLAIESISLLVFIPEFYCVLSNDKESCDERLPFSFTNAALMGVIGPTRLNVFYGHLFFALIRFRVFCLLRHWKNMWIRNAFINTKWKNQRGVWRSIVPYKTSSSRLPHDRKSLLAYNKKNQQPMDPDILEQKKRETALTNASTIGTALMVTNSYRHLTLLWVIVGLFPLVFCVSTTLHNPQAYLMTKQMQATNLVAADNNNTTCEYLWDSVFAWFFSVTSHDFLTSNDPFVMSLDINPKRCKFQYLNGTYNQLCRAYDGDEFEAYQGERYKILKEVCDLWYLAANSTEMTSIRDGSILYYSEEQLSNLTDVISNSVDEETFSVYASFNAAYAIQYAALYCLILQFVFLIMVLGGLSVLRRDAEVLVLGPLRRMLKRVARYARNPLMPLMPPKEKRVNENRSTLGRTKPTSVDDDDDLEEWNSEASSDDEGQDQADGGDEDLALGSYETEQLNTAVNKITDLLRKCWGVAGADIISTNLATRGGALTEVFNPTVSGKSVYALFGFVALNDFGHVLRELQDEVMILINDVAAVLHDEVFRWGFGDSGQCNKNLGSAFLMVFRIGLVEEVIEKLEQATDVVFSTKSSQASLGKRRHLRHSSFGSSGKSSLATNSGHGSSGGASGTRVSSGRSSTSQLRRKEKRPTQVNPMSLSLQSLPGIATFTDRAVIGMLKSFAGIYRDNKIRNWNNDFRLGQGVGVFTVSMIFGMDAGWAVEGAVGSEYKIDATYLSPHVNMASRMMAACRQYNVTILLSQAVQELMSDVARTKLRHLDTVTVKGSSVKQRIYTYDARAKGVDFFLYSRPDDQADFDSEHYTPQIWNTDQDLKAMRQHVSEEFLEEFNSGRKAFLAGDWTTARKRLERANEMMVETALEEGYLEDEFDAVQVRAGEDPRAAEEELKEQNGDGPSIVLLSFMKQYGGVAPKGWEGWHPLTRK